MKQSSQASGADLLLSIATLAAIAAALIVNALSNLFPPGGRNVGEIANTILSPVQIIPANYAFAIWGVIYLGLITYGIYQLRQSWRSSLKARRVNVYLVIACLSQMAWIYLFTVRQFGISILAMLGILLPLIAAYLQLDASHTGPRTPTWTVQRPFSLYLGWISVATIVNVACALFAAKWNAWGLSAEVWTIGMTVVAAGLAAVVVLQQLDLTFALVFVWALIAIAIRQWIALPAVGISAAIATLFLLILLFFNRHQLR